MDIYYLHFFCFFLVLPESYSVLNSVHDLTCWSFNQYQKINYTNDLIKIGRYTQTKTMYNIYTHTHTYIYIYIHI
ncbi:hypothetical protein EDC94DRAFT_621477 [Helicostylum pulchrum]|nr:hypothetical protein EDC94DRAFT_621477 [Helicostylum pulchrum]